MAKRAPRGYRIIRWSDGMFHLYKSGTAECIDEFVRRSDAITHAQQHRAKTAKAEEVWLTEDEASELIDKEDLHGLKILKRG